MKKRLSRVSSSQVRNSLTTISLASAFLNGSSCPATMTEIPITLLLLLLCDTWSEQKRLSPLSASTVTFDPTKNLYEGFLESGSFLLPCQIGMDSADWQPRPRGCTEPIQVSSTDGQIAFSPNNSVYSMAASCKDKELAWEFIKFSINEIKTPSYRDKYMSEGGIDIARGSIPINKKNCRKYAIS